MSQRVVTYVVRSGKCCTLEQLSQPPYLGMRIREQMGNLRLQRAGIDNFSKRCVRRQRKQISRHIERARPQCALIRLLLHLARLGRGLREITKDLFRNRFVCGKEIRDSSLIKFATFVVLTEIRRVVAALQEILVAGRALLAVPSLLVGNDDGCEYRKPLNRQRNVREVSNGAVPVLEVKGVEEFLRLL